MTKVFVVTHGSYSDYRIVGVFSKRQLAQEFVDVQTDSFSRFNAIETYEVDSDVEQIRAGLHAYKVDIQRNGDARTWLANSVDEFDTKFKMQGHPKNPDTWRLVGCVWAESEQHALKIANEKRVQLVVLDQWEVKK